MEFTARTGGHPAHVWSTTMDIDDLNDWQRLIYLAIAESGPLTEDQIVRATFLPAKEVRPIVAWFAAGGAIRETDSGWRVA